MEIEKNITYWQERLQEAKYAYGNALSDMERYDELLSGTDKIKNRSGGQAEAKAKTVRNICYELIEAQVDTNIPFPKVTAQVEKNIPNARRLENKLRNERDRLPFEKMDDMAERICPSSGGAVYWIDWNNFERTHDTVGELEVRVLHPKQFIPQPGVYEVNEMDYFFIEISQTKDYIWKKYRINVSGETEENPSARSFSPEHSDDKVTQIIAYYRNENGGIGKFSFVNQTVLEDLKDYQSRLLRRCKKCGNIAWEEKCPICGSGSFVTEKAETETLFYDVLNEDGSVKIPAGTKVPFYKPDIYPVVFRKNVSKYGSLLGSSDIEVIADIQETIKKIETDSLEKLLMGGSYFIQPKGKRIRKDDTNLKTIEIETPAEKQMFDVLNVQGDITKNMSFVEEQYQRARQIIGITDSFQGRKDTSATSGSAKQVAVQQSAGRLESKKMMKRSCYADIYEVMAKFLIAFADEPRPVRSVDEKNAPLFEVFSRYDFLAKDKAGEWYYDLDFVFSVDNASALAQNREALWQETRMNLTQGAFGDPNNPRTLLTFWSVMEALHYPSANMIKKQFETEVQNQLQLENMQNEINSLQANNQNLIGALEGAKGFIESEAIQSKGGDIDEEANL